MTTTQEMVTTLFDKHTLEKVANQFSNGIEKTPVDSFDMPFRLFKSKANSINLELMVQMPADDQEAQDVLGMDGWKTQTMVRFSKPIGFYTRTSNNKVSITILKEFERDLDILIENDRISSDMQVKKLTLDENAVLAAFSAEAYVNAKKYKDCSFLSNGLECDILMTFDGYPQVYLDDKHGLEGPIAAYLLREKGTVNPMIQYKDIFDKFFQMDLMTVFKQF